MAAYASLEDLKAWLGIPPATTTSDELLTRLLDAATAAMNTYMNRVGLLSATYTEARDGNGNKRLMARNWPVTAVGSITINGESIPVSSSWDASGYCFDSTSFVLRNRVFCDGVQNVALTYTAGYAAIPADVEQACIEMAGMRFRTKDTTASGWVSKSLAGETVSFSQKDMSSAVKSTLNEYKAVIAV